MFANQYLSRKLPSLFNVAIVLSLLMGSALVAAPARAAGAITVTTNADELNSNGLCSLREAITNANNDAQTQTDCVSGSGNDTIDFANGITSITLGSMLPNITDADGLTIEGGSYVTISGGNAFGVFYITGPAVLALQDITVTGGNAFEGGGVSNNGGTLTIASSTFSGNTATNSAGGVMNNAGTATIIGSTFSGNSVGSGDGGAINNVLGTLTIANSTFANNSANSGGGVMNNSGTATIYNSTFSGNTAVNGGALGIWQGAVPLPVTTLHNTILANSSSAEDCWNGSPGPLSGGNNIIKTTSSCTSIATITTDPALGGLTGSPAFFPLNSGSPAINAGDDASCAAAPVSNTSENGVTRPQGAHCDIGSVERPRYATFRSVGAQDGWVLESSERSNMGGTMDAAATTFNLGDDAANRQYRAILSFNTASLPDTAVVTYATLKIKKQGLVGTNPFTTHGALRVFIRKPSFGSLALQLMDFQVAPASPLAASFGATPVSTWYSALFNGAGVTGINRSGTTQFRLRFTLDDNNDHGADFVKFFSGNSLTVANRPELDLEYYVP